MSEQPSPAVAADDPRVTRALEEYLAALEAGQVPDRGQLLERYPDIADVLGDYLDGLDFLHQTAVDMHATSCDRPAGAAPPDAPVPFLEDYEIVREVGRGGMGIVYEAVQRSLRRRVALKVLSLGATLDPRHLQRFRNEAQAAAQLRHPNIVPVYAVGCEQGVHYYAMQLIDGEGLDRAAVRLKPDFATVARWGVQAAEALEYAHQIGVIHRDVKPANLLLDDAGQVWVADFGLARWPADHALTQSGDLLGTLRYMSPEQASARRGLVDHRTDVYSLGATLYELVTRRPVFRGDDRQELLHQILHDDPVPPCHLCPDIPRDLETILLKALGKQVEERYGTAQELADDLRRFLDGRPVLARRPGPWERAGKWARRHRPVVVSAAVLLVVTVLGLSAGTVLIGREQARTQAAYEQEAEAREQEAEARARAEKNFRQAQQLLDQIAEIAAVDMSAEADVPQVRRKLLQAALTYYKDFIEQQSDNQLTHEELLRGYTRVATLLDATGRRDDARVAWDKAIRIALTSQDGEATLQAAPAKNRIRLLKLTAVREELKLSPEQVRAVLELAPKRKDHPEAVEKEVVGLLRPEQAGRLEQLLLQQAGLWALADPVVTASIKLTPAQREALAAKQKEARATKRTPGGAGEHDDRSSPDRIGWVLTAEQRSRWRELVGEPFAGTLPPPDLVLSGGTFIIRFNSGGPAADQKKDSGTP